MSRTARRIVWSWLALAHFAMAAELQDRATRFRGLGVERISGVRESGFHNTEGETEADSFRWTDGKARLVVPFDGTPPAMLHVRLDLGLPKPTRLTIRANGTNLFDETVKPQGEWTRNFDLRDAVKASPLEIEILSDAFVPAGLDKASDDDRSLGVKVRAIKLVDKVCDPSGINLAVESIPGVDLSGVHELEKAGKNSFRWTDGKTRLAVPVAEGRKWKSLTVLIETPDRPDWRVKVAVNGRTLFDEVVRPERTFRRELSLEGVDLGKVAAIELTTPAIPPGQGRSKDSRALGVRLRELTLIGE